MHELLYALDYMHSHNIIHRDLKLGNLFLSCDMHLKVGDFGLATQVTSDDERKKTICGTPNYIAPEVLFDQDNGHSYEVDVWSLGVILFTMVVGRPPFQTKDVRSIYKRIREIEYQFPTGVEINPDARNLIEILLQKDPRSRPSISEIKRSPYIQGPKPSRIHVSALSSPTPLARSVARAPNVKSLQERHVQPEQRSSSKYQSMDTRYPRARGGLVGAVEEQPFVPSNSTPSNPLIPAGKLVKSHYKADTLASRENIGGRELTPCAGSDSSDSHTPRQIHGTHFTKSTPINVIESHRTRVVDRPAEDNGLQESKQTLSQLAARQSSDSHAVTRAVQDRDHGYAYVKAVEHSHNVPNSNNKFSQLSVVPDFHPTEKGKCNDLYIGYRYAVH
jgi:serine/threonine protein kinase